MNCPIEGCKRPVKRLGMCFGHSSQFLENNFSYKKNGHCRGSKCTNQKVDNMYCADCKADMNRNRRKF